MKRFKKKKISYGVVAVLIIAAGVFLTVRNPKNQSDAERSAPKPSTLAAQKFNHQLYPLDRASSLWVVVNKGRALPGAYVPANLVVPNVALRLSSSDSEMEIRADTAVALEKMFSAAKQNGISLMLASGYRSYSEQVAVYANYVKTSGTTGADTYSARPGHSEHQTGLAADIEPTSRTCELDQCFANTAEGQWLAANSYKYGFIIRYQKNAQNLTGYEYEPWHVRYVGIELAQQIHQTGLTLEQFFGLPAYVNYPDQSLILNS